MGQKKEPRFDSTSWSPRRDVTPSQTSLPFFFSRIGPQLSPLFWNSGQVTFLSPVDMGSMINSCLNVRISPSAILHGATSFSGRCFWEKGFLPFSFSLVLHFLSLPGLAADVSLSPFSAIGPQRLLEVGWAGGGGIKPPVFSFFF